MGRRYNFPAFLEQLHSELCRDGELNHSEAWFRRVNQAAAERLDEPHEFLDWARQDRHWSFTLAEVMREVWSHPSELASRLLVAILIEMREEQQTAQALSE